MSSWAEGRESFLCSLWENPSLEWKSQLGEGHSQSTGVPSLCLPLGIFPHGLTLPNCSKVFSLIISMGSGGWAFSWVEVLQPFLFMASGLFNLENAPFETRVSLLRILRSPLCPQDSARTLSFVLSHPWSPLLEPLIGPPACPCVLGHDCWKGFWTHRD